MRNKHHDLLRASDHEDADARGEHTYAAEPSPRISASAEDEVPERGDRSVRYVAGEEGTEQVSVGPLAQTRVQRKKNRTTKAPA